MRPFLFEMAVISIWSVLLAICFFYPPFEFSIPGVHYNACLLTVWIYTIFAIFSLMTDIRQRAPYTWVKSGLRVIVLFVITWISEGMFGVV